MIRDYAHSLAYLQGLMTLEAAARKPRGAQGAQGPLSSMTRCRSLLNRLGNPERKLHFVHVTGTSGKGSTVALLQSVLVAAGQRVGAYCSPHISTPLERIQIQGRLVPMELWLEGLRRLKPLIEADHRQSEEAVPSYQTVLFALALWAFAEADVALALVEVGIGGRMDTTNLIPPPMLALVTEVGLDHTEILGPDIPTIARDKAGIFKPGSHAMTLSRRPEAVSVMVEEAARVGIPLWRSGAHIQVSREVNGLSVKTPMGSLDGLKTSLPGSHQLYNVALVTAAAQFMNSKGISIPEDAIRYGLTHAFLPGRCEEVTMPGGGLLLLDMAHNPDKIEGLVRHWLERSPGAQKSDSVEPLRISWPKAIPESVPRRGIVVVSISYDKNVEEILRLLSTAFEKVFFTRPLETVRPMHSPSSLMQAAQALGIEAEVFIDPSDAVREAFRCSPYVVVTGSTYLVGEVRQFFNPEKEILSAGALQAVTTDSVQRFLKQSA